MCNSNVTIARTFQTDRTFQNNDSVISHLQWQVTDSNLNGYRYHLWCIPGSEIFDCHIEWNAANCLLLDLLLLYCCYTRCIEILKVRSHLSFLALVHLLPFFLGGNSNLSFLVLLVVTLISMAILNSAWRFSALNAYLIFTILFSKLMIFVAFSNL